MVKEIENCKLQNENCKLLWTRANPGERGFRRRSQFAICNSQFAIRNGFTLVEVLVVITIIGLLVGLLLPAIAGARRRARVTVIKMEMTQLMDAIENFRTSVGGGRYPPDGTNSTDTLQFLRAAFPRCPASNYPLQLTQPYTTTSVFNPSTALVFWLGGAQDQNGQFIGFSANPQNPFDAPIGGQIQVSSSRLSVPFDFGKTLSNPTRFLQVNVSSSGVTVPLTNNTSSPANLGNQSTTNGIMTVNWNLYQYFPNNGQNVGAAAPYLYFKAVGGVYFTPTSSINTVSIYGTSPAQGTLPYADSTATSSFINPKTYQLLCPGLDGKYGQYPNPAGTTGIAACPQYPAGSNYDNANGTDDMTSFTNAATVGDDMH